MFPNVRLMIVAVLASIMGISCALGLFAEFRVSRDSFLRESNASAPLQLSANGSTAAVVNTAAPLGFRFETQPPTAALQAPLPEPAATPGPPMKAVKAPPQIATGSTAGRDIEQESQETTTPGTASDALPGSTIVPASVTPAAPKMGVRTTAHRWPTVGRRFRRARSAVPAQNFTVLQPAYQWASQTTFQSSQPVRRRVSRRVRLARKPVAQTSPQTTVANTSAAKPSE